jgi:hypothetical protein
MGMVCERHLFLNNLSTRTHEFAYLHYIDWINRRDVNWGQHSIIHNSIYNQVTSFEVKFNTNELEIEAKKLKSTLQVQRYLVSQCKKKEVLVEGKRKLLDTGVPPNHPTYKP